MTPRSILSSALRQTLLLDLPFSRPSALARLGLAAVAVLVTAGSASAASQTWTTGGSTALWSDTTNWGGNTAPGNTSAGVSSASTSSDTGTFNTAVGAFGTSASPVLIDSGRTIGSIVFGSSAGAFTIGVAGSNSLFLHSAGSISNVAGTAASETINAPLVIGTGSGATSYSFTSNSSTAANVLNFGGQISSGTSALTTLTLNGTNTGNNFITGNIVNGSGTVAVTLNGANTWTLSGNNTYAGGTTVTTGALNIGSATAIGTGTLSLGAGVTIDNSSGGALAVSGNDVVAISSTGFTFGGSNDLNLGSGAVSISQPTTTIALNGTNSHLTMGAVTNGLSGSNVTLNVNGVGNTLTVGGYNISNGSAAKALTLAGTANINITGAVTDSTGSGTGSTLTYTGTGTVVLSGADTYTGKTTVGSGSHPASTVQFAKEVSFYNGNSGSWTAANFRVNSGATLAMNVGGTGEFTATDVQTIISQGTSTTGFNGGSIIGLDTTNASGGNFTYGNVIANPGGQSVGVTKLGTNTLTLSVANTYTGATTVANGNLQVTGSTASGSAVTVGNGSATTAVLSGTGTVSGSVTTAAASGSNVAYLAPGSNTTGTRADFGSANTLHIGGALSLGTGTNLDYDLSSSGLSGNDKIIVGGTLTIGSALTFNYNQLSGSLDTANKYQLITFTGTAPVLSGVTFTTTGNTGYTALYSIDGGGLALDVAFTATGGSTPAAAFFNGQGTDLGTFANFDTTVSSGAAVASALGSTTNVSFNANRNATVSTATLNSALDVNSVTFGTGSGVHSGMTINGTGTMTLEATTAGGNAIGNGITVNTGAGNNAINTAVALNSDQTWTVTDSTSTLTLGSTVSGSHKLSTAGNGVVQLSGSNSYSGGTAVTSGRLLLSNTSGSATGTGALTVSAGAALSGYGSSSGTSFTIGAASAARTSVLVGMNSSTDTNTTHTLTLLGSGANTITNTTLQFNISAATIGQGTELSVGNSAITFSNTTLSLNVQGTGVITGFSPYVLIAGTGTNQYGGLTTQLETRNGTVYDVITGGLDLAFSPSLANTWYAQNSFLFLNTAGGVDDVEVAVVPEPGTWALMIGGLAGLFFWQKRRRA